MLHTSCRAQRVIIFQGRSERQRRTPIDLPVRRQAAHSGIQRAGMSATATQPGRALGRVSTMQAAVAASHTHIIMVEQPKNKRGRHAPRKRRPVNMCRRRCSRKAVAGTGVSTLTTVSRPSTTAVFCLVAIRLTNRSSSPKCRRSESAKPFTSKKKLSTVCQIEAASAVWMPFDSLGEPAYGGGNLVEAVGRRCKMAEPCYTERHILAFGKRGRHARQPAWARQSAVACG